MITASERFASRIASAGEPPGTLIGLEHEYVVRDGERPVDFRTLVGEIDLRGQRLDPGDVNAHRCAWGGVVTADGAEAEIATPPLDVRPGFVSRLEAEAGHGATHLVSTLPPRLQLEGYSTHLSVTMPDAISTAVCETLTSTFAPGLMLLGDHAGSPGLLLRPRVGRVEAAFEFATGASLHACSTYFTGAALAVASGLPLPPHVCVDAVATADRVGWGLRRTAFGVDVLRDGRRARLITRDGTSITAQQHLEAAWDVARAALNGHVAASDIDAANRLVSGADPLPIECERPDLRPPAALSEAEPSAYGDILEAVERPGFVVSAYLATWDVTLFSIIAATRSAFAAVPRQALSAFLSLLRDGALDAVVRDYLTESTGERHLAGWEHAQQPGLYDSIADPTSFIAPEASYVPAVATDVRGDRYGKVPPTEPGRPIEPDPRRPWWPIIGILIGLLIGGGLTYTLMSRPERPVPTATPSTAATPTPATLEFPPNEIFDGCIRIDPQGNTTTVDVAFTVSNPANGDYRAAYEQSPTGRLAGTGHADGTNPIVVPVRATRFGTYDNLTIAAPDGARIDLGPLAAKLPFEINARTNVRNDCEPSALRQPTPQTLAGRAYLDIVAPVNAAAAEFNAASSRWTSATTSQAAQADAAKLRAAFEAVESKLLPLASAYPPAGDALRASHDAVASLLDDLRALEAGPSAAWLADFRQDLASLSRASAAVRTALGIAPLAGA